MAAASERCIGMGPVKLSRPFLIFFVIIVELITVILVIFFSFKAKLSKTIVWVYNGLNVLGVCLY